MLLERLEIEKVWLKANNPYKVSFFVLEMRSENGDWIFDLYDTNLSESDLNKFIKGIDEPGISLGIEVREGKIDGTYTIAIERSPENSRDEARVVGNQIWIQYGSYSSLIENYLRACRTSYKIGLVEGKLEWLTEGDVKPLDFEDLGIPVRTTHEGGVKPFKLD